MENYDKIRQRITEENAFNPTRDLSEIEDVRSKYNEGQTPVWSHSRLKEFERCKYSIYLREVMRAPRAPKSRALIRGNRVHDDAEKYVKDTSEPLTKELFTFKMSFEKLRRLYKTGVIQTEEKWGFTRDWDECTWDDKDVLWARMKLDVIWLQEDSAYVIDYKTGKKKGNEIAHTDQGISYAIGTIMKYPQVQEVQAEFWYLDEKEKLIKQYSREQLLYLIPNLERRAHAMTTCMDYPPSPSISNCKFCEHREKDSCDYAESL